MTREQLNKLVFELGCCIFENEPSLTPEQLTIDTVRAYAEGARYELSEQELDELVYVAYHANHVVYN